MVCISRIWLAALAISIAVGCAGANVERGPQYAQDRLLPRPPVLVVYDFAVDANDVVVDTFGPNFLNDTASHSEEVATARTIASSLSETLVAELGKRGIRAQRATHASPPPLNAAVVKGQFLTIQEGDRTTRMLIGFGVGAEKIRVRVQVYQVAESGLRRIAESEGEAHGDRMPGMAVPVGAGAAMGRAASSAAISGGMNVMQEVTGGLDKSVENLAEELAERAVSFYTRQGWL